MSENTKGPVQAHRTHNMRYSDSSMYDEKCSLCGLTDNYPEALALPCTQDASAASAVVAKIKAEKALEIAAKAVEDWERVKKSPAAIALERKFKEINSRGVV